MIPKIFNHWPNPASVPTVTLQLLGYGEVCGVLGEDQGNDGQVTVGLGGGLRGAAVYLPGWKCFGVSTILGAVSSMYQRSSAQPVGGAVATRCEPSTQTLRLDTSAACCLQEDTVVSRELLGFLPSQKGWYIPAQCRGPCSHLLPLEKL